ncbi:hypothetical protein EG327_002511, partial [Venturia inaequalis]
KAKRKALREGGSIVPTEVEDSADEDEETDNKSKNSDEEPIIDEEENSYEDIAPEIISSKEKEELLATKKACEKAKLAKLSDSDEEEITEDEPLEEPSQPKDTNATTEEYKNKLKAELDKLVKKELIKIILEIRKAAEPNKELEELQ